MDGNLRKLTEDEYITLETMMQEVPDPNETFSATGMHYELAALLIKFGFRPIGRYETYRMSMSFWSKGTMVKPDFIRINGLVRVNGYVGWIVDIAESDSSLMIKVDSAKCARRFQKPDWLDFNAAPEMWSPATLEDLEKDAEHEKNAALKSIRAVEEYVTRALDEMDKQEINQILTPA